MDPEADSYEKLLTVCRRLHLPEVDCQEVFRRLVFNILANNTDRSLAEKNRVREEWIGRIESCLSEHLSSWGFMTRKATYTYTLPSGHRIETAHIETAYKGNYHLLASIDGKEMKYIIRMGMPEHDAITKVGQPNIPEEMIKELVNRFFLPKLGSNI